MTPLCCCAAAGSGEVDTAKTAIRNAVRERMVASTFSATFDTIPPQKVWTLQDAGLITGFP